MVRHIELMQKISYYSENRKCIVCEESLNKRQRAFCSRSCRNKVIKRRKRTRTIIKKCKYCGKDFASFISQNKKFHDNACKIAYFKLYPNRPWLGKKRPEIVRFFTMKGKHHTEKWKKERSKQLKGRPISEKQKRQISKTLMGHPPNPGSGRGKSGWREDILHYCRSTWEANLARTLIHDNILYFYEPKKFYFDGFSYTPDIYIPELDWWIEIKGFMSEDAERKIKAFRNLGYTLTVIAKIEYEFFKKKYKHKIPIWE